MHLVFPAGWISGDTVSALCWTLLHSLWQGLLAAVVAGTIILCTRRAAASLRYNLLGGVVLFFLAGVVFTFCRLASHPVFIPAAAGGQTSLIFGDTLPLRTEAPALSRGMLNRGINILNSNAPVLVLFWLSFFLWKCARLFMGLASIQRIRHSRNMSPGAQWKSRMDGLRRRLGIRMPVRLLQSSRVSVPVVVGFFRPVIFVPFGLLANLAPDQAETILLHELAHVRRRDYLVNMVQRFAEAVFFFNPALLWISSLIRQEREACCDDIVVAHTRHKKSYLQALVFFQEHRLAATPFAMALGTNRNYLLTRVKRMLTRENKKLNFMEKVLLLGGLAFITAFSFIPASTPAHQERPSPVPREQPLVSTANAVAAEKEAVPVKRGERLDRVYKMNRRDTVPSPQMNPGLKITGLSANVSEDGKIRNEVTTATDDKGKKYTIKKVNNELVELSIDGIPVPSSEITNHNAVLQQIETAVRDRHEQNQKMVAERKAMALESQEKRKQLQAQRRQMTEEMAQKRMAERQETDANRKQQMKLIEQERHRANQARHEQQQAVERDRKQIMRLLEQERSQSGKQDRQQAVERNRKQIMRLLEQERNQSGKQDRQQEEQWKQKRALLDMEQQQRGLDERRRELRKRIERSEIDRKEIREVKERPEARERKERKVIEKRIIKRNEIEKKEIPEQPEQPERPEVREKKERKEKKEMENKEAERKETPEPASDLNNDRS